MKISQRPSDNLKLCHDAARGAADLIQAGQLPGADETTRAAVRGLLRAFAGELSGRSHVPMERPLTVHRQPYPQDVATAAALLRGNRLRRVNQADRQHAADTLDRAWETLRRSL